MKKIAFISLLWLSISGVFAQNSEMISGIVKDKTNTGMPYANVLLKTEKDSVFVVGVAPNEEGRFSFDNIIVLLLVIL
ncbi:MAG: carboxypeptidase-like regulatory domain-containing protein [Chitinophagales bacterium]